MWIKIIDGQLLNLDKVERISKRQGGAGKVYVVAEKITEEEVTIRICQSYTEANVFIDELFLKINK